MMFTEASQVRRACNRKKSLTDLDFRRIFAYEIRRFVDLKSDDKTLAARKRVLEVLQGSQDALPVVRIVQLVRPNVAERIARSAVLHLVDQGQLKLDSHLRVSLPHGS